MEWIPVTERLPEVGATILLYDSWSGNFCVGKMVVLDKRNRWDVSGSYIYSVVSDLRYTHWMPLPEPPDA